VSPGPKIRATVLGLLAAAALALAGIAAAAHVPTSNITIKIQGTHGELVSNLHVFGKVSSSTRACVAGRKVKILSVGPKGSKLIDTDRTDRRGSFRGGGGFGGEVNGARMKATRSVVSRNGHRLGCEPDADFLRIL
jgi:hypothetical protein